MAGHETKNVVSARNRRHKLNIPNISTPWNSGSAISSLHKRVNQREFAQKISGNTADSKSPSLPLKRTPRTRLVRSLIDELQNIRTLFDPNFSLPAPESHVMAHVTLVTGNESRIATQAFSITLGQPHTSISDDGGEISRDLDDREGPANVYRTGCLPQPIFALHHEWVCSHILKPFKKRCGERKRFQLKNFDLSKWVGEAREVEMNLHRSREPIQGSQRSLEA